MCSVKIGTKNSLYHVCSEDDGLVVFKYSNPQSYISFCF